MKQFFSCFLCGMIVYEAYLGERHIHIPESQYPTTPPVSSFYFVGTATINTAVSVTLTTPRAR